eukprot:Partr_v1_DN26944_c0_g1_i2_m7123 putative protein kinase kinase kinase
MISPPIIAIIIIAAIIVPLMIIGCFMLYVYQDRRLKEVEVEGSSLPSKTLASRLMDTTRSPSISSTASATHQQVSSSSKKPTISISEPRPHHQQTHTMANDTMSYSLAKNPTLLKSPLSNETPSTPPAVSPRSAPPQIPRPRQLTGGRNIADDQTIPRQSVMMTIKNMSKNRVESTFRAKTLIDTRKVFALPAFLQIDSLDDILLTDMIAQGGLGAVWRGEMTTAELEDRNLGDKRCAVKVIVLQSNSDEEWLEILTCFRQEVTIIYGLAPHDNIVRIVGYAETSTNDMVMVEELCKTNLNSVIHETKDDDRLLLEEIFVILVGVLDGLMWMHRHGVIHNDIKPMNVLLNYANNRVEQQFDRESSSGKIRELIPSARYVAKICDMGLASIEVLEPIMPKAQKGPSSASGGDHKPRPRTRANHLREGGNGRYKSIYEVIADDDSQRLKELMETVAPIYGGKRSRIKGFSTRYASPESIILNVPGHKYTEPKIYKTLDFQARSNTDMWGFGVLVWEVLERRLPYATMSDEEVKKLVTETAISHLEPTEASLLAKSSQRTMLASSNNNLSSTHKAQKSPATLKFSEHVLDEELFSFMIVSCKKSWHMNPQKRTCSEDLLALYVDHITKQLAGDHTQYS